MESLSQDLITIGSVFRYIAIDYTQEHAGFTGVFLCKVQKGDIQNSKDLRQIYTISTQTPIIIIQDNRQYAGRE